MKTTVYRIIIGILLIGITSGCASHYTNYRNTITANEIDAFSRKYRDKGVHFLAMSFFASATLSLCVYAHGAVRIVVRTRLKPICRALLLLVLGRSPFKPFWICVFTVMGLPRALNSRVHSHGAVRGVVRTRLKLIC